MNKEQKAATIEEIAAQIEGADAIFAVDYRGISVPQAAQLRSKLREADASFRVVKNRLTKLAAKQAGEDRLDDMLEGPTALTFVRGDTALAAKALSTFNKENDVLAFKGGFMDGLLLDEDRFKAIARLPGRDVLNGQLAGVVASPLTGLVRGLGSMIQGLALQLGQIAEKGLVSGDAAPAAPAAEEPSDTDDTSEEASQPDSPAASEGEQPDENPPAADAEEGAPAESDSPADAPVEEPPMESSAENEPPAEEEPSQAEGDDQDETSGAEETSEEESQSDSSPPSEEDGES